MLPASRGGDLMAQQTQHKPIVTGAVITLLGAAMLWPALQLLLAGGTPNYLAASGLLLASGIELMRGQTRGFYVFAVLLLLTLVWAVSESGTGFWTVGSRIWLIGLLALWLCTPMIRRKLWGDGMPPLLSMRTVQVCTVTAMTGLLSMVIDVNRNTVKAIPERPELTLNRDSDWSAYRASKAGTRYAPSDQINTRNVHKLTKAWEFDTGRIG